MRWVRPTDGAVRYKTAFLWYPKTIGVETRWLERARWRECFKVDSFGGARWREDAWLEPERVARGSWLRW